MVNSVVKPATPSLLILRSGLVGTAVELPEEADNLFERLVRDPLVPERPVRELLCTEMLCSVLRNTSRLRQHLFECLAEKSGVRAQIVKGLEWRIETEQDADGKRIDLLIEGWVEHEGQRERRILWIIELKVDAPLQDSQPGCYDRWMIKRETEYRAGFVLARNSDVNKLPRALRPRWRCISWTWLGIEVEKAIRSLALPAAESLLAAHLLGFIRLHFWEESEMPKQQLTFDDVALLRAFAVLGQPCEEKVKELVQPLVEVVKKSGLARSKPKVSSNLYNPSKCCVVEWRLDRAGRVWLWAGVYEDAIFIDVISSPQDSRKPAIRKAAADRKAELHKRDRNWIVGKPDPDSWTDEWDDVYLQIPLEVLLSEDDQAAALRRIVTKALNDLKVSGIAAAIERAASGRSK